MSTEEKPKKRLIIFYYIKMFKYFKAILDDRNLNDQDKLSKLNEVFDDKDFTLSCRNNQAYEDTIDTFGSQSMTMGRQGSIVLNGNRLDWPNKSFDETWNEQNPNNPLK